MAISLQSNNMASNQKVEYFPNTPIGEGKSSLERLNEFISNPDINAKSISTTEHGIFVLYEWK
jgi:hypothetical protein